MKKSRRAFLTVSSSLGVGTIAGCTSESSQSITTDGQTAVDTAGAPATPAANWEWTPGDTQSLGDGFRDHGPTGIVVGKRGYIGTSDGVGNDVVVMWLWESGSYMGWPAMVNIDTGEFREFRSQKVFQPSSTMLSTDNKVYTMNENFAEFDPTKPGMTHFEPIPVDDPDTQSFSAFSMAEGPDGTIWGASNPNARVVSFDPETRELRQFGSVFEHEAHIYPLTLAIDDGGWVYVPISNQGVAVVALNTETGETRQPLEGREWSFNSNRGFRVHPTGDGRVYGNVRSSGKTFELYEGEATELEETPAAFDGFDFNERTYEIDGKQVVTGYYRISFGNLPSGRRVTEFKVERKQPYVVVEGPDSGETTRIEFTSEGGATQPLGIETAPDNTLAGGTYHPLQFLNYDPKGDRWYYGTKIHGQLNVAAAAEDYLYFAVYTSGGLYAWDPYEPWDPPRKKDHPQNRDRNPKWVTTAISEKTDRGTEIGRPWCLLVHPNGRDVVMGGNKGYGEGFGGLLFWDRDAQRSTVLPHEEVIPNHNTYSLTALGNGNILGGTSTEPAAAGVAQAETAELYELDPDEKEVVWRDAIYDDVTSERGYWDLKHHDGIVYGVTYPRGTNRYFAFDPEDRAVVFDQDLDRRTPHQQGPQIFHEAPNGRLFMVFVDGSIAEIDTESHSFEDVASVPEAGQEPQGGHGFDDLVRNGGTVHDGRLYVLTDSRLLSWQIE
jgi:hypothetical protein